MKTSAEYVFLCMCNKRGVLSCGRGSQIHHEIHVVMLMMAFVLGLQVHGSQGDLTEDLVCLSS